MNTSSEQIALTPYSALRRGVRTLDDRLAPRRAAVVAVAAALSVLWTAKTILVYWITLSAESVPTMLVLQGVLIAFALVSLVLVNRTRSTLGAVACLIAAQVLAVAVSDHVTTDRTLVALLT